MKHLVTILIFTLLLVASDDLSLEDDFLSGLEEVSEIATKTKLNIDDTPSFVTVLHNEKLQKLGVNNVFEALGVVPGVQLKREASGVPVVIFRGISQKGEVKLLVDGVTINNTYRGSIYYFLDFPIELVERIEVIRGPGSVLYGSGAISGVINIITKSSIEEDKNNVFISGGTYDNYKAGTLVSMHFSDVKVALDAYKQRSLKMIEGTDRHLDDYSVGLNINDDHFGLMARVKQSEIGNSYGVLGVYDTTREKNQNINSHISTQLSYNNSLSKDTDIEVLAGFNRYGQIIEAQHPSAGSIDADYSENNYYGQIDIISTIIPDNKFLIGLKYQTAKIIESLWKIATTEIPSNVNPDASRDTTSLYLNDNYSITENFDISAGLRYDDYSDIGDAVSPSLGLVYKLNQEIILKALYANAFRAPSWVELFSNPSLEAETSKSFEAGAVYKLNRKNTFRLNLYQLKLENMITKDTTTNNYIQTSHNNFRGSEFEYAYLASNQVEFNLFASYIDAKDENDNDLADIANILATTSLIYTSDYGISFGSLLKYVSTENRDDSLIFDETISYNYKNFTVNFIIRDLFNQGTYYALPSTTANDYYDGDRSFLLRASMEF